MTLSVVFGGEDWLQVPAPNLFAKVRPNAPSAYFIPYIIHHRSWSLRSGFSGSLGATQR